MKQLIYILGVTTSITIVVGLYFLLQNWPGSGFILTLSTILSVIFIPLFAVYQYMKDKS